eukprot:348399_1
MLSLLNVGQAYHHNLIDIFTKKENDKEILIQFRIHHVKLINQPQSNAVNILTTAPPTAPNANNFNFESWSEIYYVGYDLLAKTFSKINKFGFNTLPLSKTSTKESNCVETIKFSENGKFFAMIKQREHNDE